MSTTLIEGTMYFTNAIDYLVMPLVMQMQQNNCFASVRRKSCTIQPVHCQTHQATQSLHIIIFIRTDGTCSHNWGKNYYQS